MNWRFWNTDHGEGPKPIKPKDLPAAVGRDLVVKLRMDPDWVWKLKCVLRPMAGSKSRYEVRVFSPNSSATLNVAVKDFGSLDEHPELILFEGWFDKNTNQVDIKQRGGPRPKARAA